MIREVTGPTVLIGNHDAIPGIHLDYTRRIDIVHKTRNSLMDLTVADAYRLFPVLAGGQTLVCERILCVDVRMTVHSVAFMISEADQCNVRVCQVNRPLGFGSYC